MDNSYKHYVPDILPLLINTPELLPTSEMTTIMEQENLLFKPKQKLRPKGRPNSKRFYEVMGIKKKAIDPRPYYLLLRHAKGKKTPVVMLAKDVERDMEVF